ncbi:ribosomal protein L7/L12 [Sulfobacillus thermosulfidooxidans]|uniref:ribosomal protein L7/L12 n=1 Tax=Sulfobacillus thermosulfidooxidans TaxID=28034 RepID=UPI0003030BCE|nr:ribosomal protein L7/L12 [Sulfobacillus thermosulfidooxidans]
MNKTISWIIAVGLSVAFVVIEYLYRNEQESVEKPVSKDELTHQIMPLIAQNKKIAAIRMVRNTLGCSLLEAKEFVDNLVHQGLQ